MILSFVRHLDAAPTFFRHQILFAKKKPKKNNATQERAGRGKRTKKSKGKLSTGTAAPTLKKRPTKSNFITNYSKMLAGLGMDYRYLYLMERVSRKSLYSKATFQHEVKIGIAKNQKRRHAEVNKAIKGKVVLAMQIKVLRAYRREQFLHRLFAASRFRIKGGNGGGRTEWFYLNWLEYSILIFWLYWFKIEYYVYFFLIIAALILYRANF